MNSLKQLQQQNAQLQAEVARLRAQLTESQQQQQQAVSAAGARDVDGQDDSIINANSSTVAAIRSTALSFNSPHGLTKAQVERYSRQLLLPAFGVSAQDKLCSSSILIVGCGGLGSPAALYLAAAGVGKLGLVDHDVVELSNMHRQVIHTEGRLGMHKAQSAAIAVQALNSSVAMEVHLDGLHPSNAVHIISSYDVVIDASDNPPTRYLISDACVACGVPLVSAAAVGTDGQLTVYNYGDNSPCYRCLFPECPAPANCSRCADAGVLGPVPGVMGVLQALEAMKAVSGAGTVLTGKLLLYDALAARFNTIKLRGKAPGCMACGQHASINKDSIASYDYMAFTGGQKANDGAPPPLAVLPAEQRLTVKQLKERLYPAQGAVAPATQGNAAETEDGAAIAAAVEPGVSGQQQQQQQHDQSNAYKKQPLLLDVRPPEQFAIMALPGAVNMPFTQVEQRLPEVLQLCSRPGNSEHHGVSANHSNGGAANADSGSNSSSSNMRPVYVMCRRGNHSQLAVQQLRQAGVVHAVDVVGGYEAWAAEVDPSMPAL